MTSRAATLRPSDGPDAWTLDLQGFDRFQDWLVRCVDHWLDAENAANPARLRAPWPDRVR